MTCPECGQTPVGEACYHICPNSDHYYSPERERHDDQFSGCDRYDGWGDPDLYAEALDHGAGGGDPDEGWF